MPCERISEIRRKHHLQRETSADRMALYTANEQPSRTDVARKSRFVYGVPARLSPLENQRRAQLVSHCPSSFHRPCASEQASIALTVRKLEGSLIHTFVFILLHRTELQRRWLRSSWQKSFSHLASSAKPKAYSPKSNPRCWVVKHDRLCATS